MYVAEYLDKDGFRHKTEVVGASEAEIRLSLAKDGKACLKVTKVLFTFGKNEVKKEELVAAFVAIGDMLNAGVPLSQTIGPVVSSFPYNSKFAAVLTHIGSVLKEGRTFSSGMALHQQVFGTEVISMIEAGESSGGLAQTFVSAGEYIMTMEEVKGSLVKKLAYPALLLGVALLTLLLNSVVIIPKLMSSPMFKSALKDLEDKEDFSAQLIGFIQDLKYIVPSGILFLGLCIFGLYVYYKTNPRECEMYLARIPTIKKLLFYQSYYVSFLAMANLMSVGARIDQALMIAGKASRLHTVQEEFESALKYLKSGDSFTRGISSLNSIERTMLDTAQNDERVKANFDLISKRFYAAYMDSTKKIAPKVYTVAIVIVISIILLTLAAIMLPYSKMLSGIK